MKSKFILCAESVSIDRQSNSLSIFNVFEEITPPAFPAFLYKITVLNILERENTEPEKLDCVLEIFIDEQKIFSNNLQVDFQNRMRNRIVSIIEGLPLPKPGMLTFNFHYLDKKSTYEIKLNVPPPSAKQAEIDLK